MSPASRSKSKDKKASKESQKACSKPPAGNAATGIPASAYNPLLGTFHTLELSPTSAASSVQTNGRFRNIDETDDHSGGSLAAVVEYDSVSNNDSWSGESEDHKEKVLQLGLRLESVPGADNDKREKIRQKNERKHQRQKEKRAQELHEQCSGYLMSRKLEALAQQLVAMGFSQERATMALILNEGRVEESVAWLFEGGEAVDEARDQHLCGTNLKIDISEELARIADMKVKFKCSKQDVERAIVTFEGDLEKAAESLRTSKQDPPSASPKPEETGDPPIFNNGRVPAAGNQILRQQAKVTAPTLQHRKDDKDFNYTKQPVTALGSLEGASKNLQPLKRVQPKPEWATLHQAALPVDNRWPNTGSNLPVSYSLVSSFQVSSSLAKTETHLGNELKYLEAGTMKEPIIVMQRPQSLMKQVPASMSSSLPGTTPSLYPSTNIEAMRSSGFMPQIPNTRSTNPNNLSSNQMFHQFQHQQQQHPLPDSSQGDYSPGSSRGGNGLWSRTSASPTLAAASSLGLFSGLGSAASSGASSPVDWNTGGSMLQLDYANIDWTLDRGLSTSRPSGLWVGLSSFMKNKTNMYDSNASGVSAQVTMRSASNVNGVSIAGLQDRGAASSETSAVGSREWTSPFEGEDLFSLPRQFVSSPSL